MEPNKPSQNGKNDTEVKELSKEIFGILTDYRLKSGELMKLVKENTDQKAEIQRLKAQNVELKDENEWLKAKINILKHAQNPIKGEEESMQILTLRAELELSRANFRAIEEQYKCSLQEIESLQQNIEFLEQEPDKAQLLESMYRSEMDTTVAEVICLSSDEEDTQDKHQEEPDNSQPKLAPEVDDQNDRETCMKHNNVPKYNSEPGFHFYSLEEDKEIANFVLNVHPPNVKELKFTHQYWGEVSDGLRQNSITDRSLFGLRNHFKRSLLPRLCKEPLLFELKTETHRKVVKIALQVYYRKQYTVMLKQYDENRSGVKASQPESTKQNIPQSQSTQEGSTVLGEVTSSTTFESRKRPKMDTDNRGNGNEQRHVRRRVKFTEEEHQKLIDIVFNKHIPFGPTERSLGSTLYWNTVADHLQQVSDVYRDGGTLRIHFKRIVIPHLHTIKALHTEEHRKTVENCYKFHFGDNAGRYLALYDKLRKRQTGQTNNRQ